MKRIIVILLVFLLVPAFVSADCTQFVEHNEAEQSNGGDALAEAEIDLSHIYGADCTEYPYKSYARVKVKCEGDKLYMQRAPQDARWEDIDFDWDKDGANNYDKKYSSGMHTITLRSGKGDVRSVFFACWDYDQADGWATVATGWGYWGDRSVFEPRVERKCSNNDVYWYDSLGRKGDKYEECGSDSCKPWGEKFCSNNQVKTARSCTKKGCSGGSCYSRYERESKVVETCSYECLNGQCVQDTDGDGIIDKKDKCPNQGSIGYGIDSVGCPQHDSDNDGVIDRGDNCPDEAGSGPWFGKGKGCPNFIEKIFHFFGQKGWIMR